MCASPRPRTDWGGLNQQAAAPRDGELKPRRCRGDRRAQGKQDQEVEEWGGKWWRRPEHCLSSSSSWCALWCLVPPKQALVAAIGRSTGRVHSHQVAWAHSPPGPLPPSKSGWCCHGQQRLHHQSWEIHLTAWALSRRYQETYIKLFYISQPLTSHPLTQLRQVKQLNPSQATHYIWTSPNNQLYWFHITSEYTHFLWHPCLVHQHSTHN